jgi:succinate-semialdehyde dehydrogenase/glutarate-semialdehyde dehydrogenase
MALSAHEQQIVDSVPTQLWIGGRWRDATGGATIKVEDPATGEPFAEIADAAGEDATAALDAACAVQDDWAKTPPRERSEILRRAFEMLTARSDDLALLMTLEMGKPLAEARGEVAYAAEFFRWFSEEGPRLAGVYLPDPSGKSRLLTMKQPVGPCLLVTPWNFPLAMGTRKIGPAIAAGCTAVIKPAQQTPLSMLALGEVLHEAGLPDGVFNIVTSSSASAVVSPLMSDPRLRKMSFTGSTEVGRTLMGQAAEHLLRVSMELGGNAPFVVCADADLDVAVEQAVLAKMRNMGESCVAANRYHVHSSVAEEFARRLADRLGDLSVGRGTEDGVDVGPLINDDQQKKVSQLVDDATTKGATQLVGGSAPDGPGHFYSPTVLTGVPESADMLRTEIFGPVAPIYPFDDLDEGVRAANDSHWGLVAYLFTSNVENALRLTERLQAGMVGVNRGLVSTPAAPFGGIKESGIGREGGFEGIEEYVETKYAALNP